MKNIGGICFMSKLPRCMVIIGLLLTQLIGVTQSEETSKACHGAAGIRCTIHHLYCVNGTIAIREAYYTDNAQCGVGLSSCNVNVSNIPETGNHKEFNASEGDILQRNCSSKSTCEFKAGRRNSMGLFSVVKYNCIQNGESTISSTNGHFTDTTQYRGHLETTTVSEKEKVVSSSKNGVPTQSDTNLSTSSLGPKELLNKDAKDEGVSPGILAGALVSTVLLIAGILLFIVYFMRKRNKETREKTKKKTNLKDSKLCEVYSVTTNIPENLYFELEKQPTVSTDYDYAAADGFENSTKHYRNNDVNSKPKPSQLPVPQVKEGDYDHIGDKLSFQKSDYDTAASVAHTMHQTVKASSLPGDGDLYSYDHLNELTNIDGAEKDVGTHSADYDTAASSRIEVAKLNSKSSNVKEDDYGYNYLGSNHQVKTIQNEYDTSASALKAVAAHDDNGATEEK